VTTLSEQVEIECESFTDNGVRCRGMVRVSIDKFHQAKECTNCGKTLVNDELRSAFENYRKSLATMAAQPNMTIRHFGESFSTQLCPRA
jgi:hypothetical protein